MKLKFNSAQKEGMAKVFDNYFFVATVTLASHIFGYLSLSNWEKTLLILLTIVSPIVSLTLRKESK